MTEHKNIHEAINAVMKEVGYVQKQSAKELRYTYAGEASMIEAIRPSLVVHGIYMHVLEVKKVYRSAYETKNGTNMFNTLIEGTVRFTHVSGTYIDAQATGEGSDSGDKSANKAMTGLYKYAMRQTFCIETGDDPDQFSSDSMERKTSSKPAQATPQKRETPKAYSTESSQEALGATQGENGGNGAVGTAETLSDAYTPNQILGSKNGELVKHIVDETGETTVEVCKYVSALEKGKKYSIGQVISALKGTKDEKA